MPKYVDTTFMYDKSYKAFLLGFSTLDMLFIGASEIENFASFPDLCETPEHFLWSQSEIEMPRFNQNMTKFDEIGTFHFLTNFTKNAVASQKVKSQKPVASL